jgi:hypothetical protein
LILAIIVSILAYSLSAVIYSCSAVMMRPPFIYGHGGEGKLREKRKKPAETSGEISAGRKINRKFICIAITCPGLYRLGRVGVI